jgi:hypothetical protein
VNTGRIFINYRRDDSRADSGRVYDHLSARFPGKVFRDVGSLEPGVDWHQAIGRVISQSDACVVVIGSNWLSIKGDDGQPRLNDPNDTVRQEIFAAIQREMFTIPLLVGGAKMPRRQDLPADLQPLCNRNALEMTEQNWTECCAKLVEALETALRVKPAPQYAIEKKSAGKKWVWIVASVAAILVALSILAAIGSQRPVKPAQDNPATQNPIASNPLVSNPVTPTSLPPASFPEPREVAPAQPSAITPIDFAGNWMAQATINGIPVSSLIQLFPDHSFRNVANNQTDAIGTWQSNNPGELELPGGTNLTNGVHFSCKGLNVDGDTFQGNCSNQLGGTWNYTLKRLPAPLDIPAAPPRVNVSGVSMAELETFNLTIASQRCTCNCGMSVLLCLRRDPTCQYSPAIAQNTLQQMMRASRQ